MCNKKLITFFTFIAVCLASLPLFFSLTPAKAWACAWGYSPENSYMGFFQNDLMMPQGRDFLKFEYDYDGNSLSISTFESRPANSEQGNYTEWKAIGNFNDADVKSFVYDSSLDQLQALRKALETGHTYNGITGAIPEYILANKDAALLDYMIFAKTCALDFAREEDRDPWEYRLKQEQESLDLALRAEQAMKTAPNNFLRLRYAYQAMRLYRARLDYARCVELFETEIEPLASNLETKEWCRAFYAGALYWQGDYAQAFLQFSKVFQGSSRYRMEAYIGCRWTLRYSSTEPKYDEIIQNALALSQSEQERMAVLVMAAYQTNFLTSINEYETGKAESYLATLLKDIAAGRVPVPADLPLLVVWQINNAEMTLLALNYPGTKFNYALPEMPEKIKNGDDSKTASQNLKAIELQLANLVDDFVKTEPAKLDNPAFWHTCLSYMAYLREDYQQAKSRLELAKLAKSTNSPFPVAVEQQIELLNAVLTATTKPLTPENEDLFEQDFQHLSSALQTLKNENSNADSPEKKNSDWLKRSAYHIWGNLLPNRYYQAGNDARAILCMARAQKLQNDAPYPYTYNMVFRALDNLPLPQLRELQKVTTSPQTEFERNLSARLLADWPASFLTEMEATQLIREHSFAEAVAAFEKQTILQQNQAASPKDTRGPEQGDSKLSINIYSPGYYEESSASSAAELNKLTLEPFNEPKAWGYSFIPAPNKELVTKLDQRLLETKILPSLQPEIDRLRAEWLEVREGKTPTLQTNVNNLQTQASNLEKTEVLLKNPTAGKYAFALQMAALQGLTKQEGELGAEALYTFAKGLYNMSYLGNSNYLFTWSRSGAEFWMYDYIQKEKTEPKPLTPADYYYNNAARNAFLEVEQTSKNPELQARALFMAALCTQIYKTTYIDYPKKPAGDYFTNNPEFEKLVKNYQQTKFYQASYRACSYLRDFEKTR